jgi:hypothetical protein
MKSDTTHLVTAEDHVKAPPERVYAVIADYRNGHPRILPDVFSGMTVEQGGTGAGTIIRFHMRVFGRTRTFRAAITEPGRVLVETDLDNSGAIRTFTVNRCADQETSTVTISTELPVRTGVLGAIERFLSTRYLRPIYVRELELLAARASGEKR